MLTKIIKYFQERGVTLPQEELKVISPLLETISFNKKEIIYKKGDTKLSLFFIVEGCVRIFIENEKKKEYNRYFAFDGYCVGEYHQILYNLPSKASAQALEKAKVIAISQDKFEIIHKKCPVFSKKSLEILLNGYVMLLEKEERNKTMTIEELYSYLVQNRPLILEKIPLYHIASYLGVKPESLSRVKKKFKE